MKDRFVFVGNRRFVLEQMLLEGLNICAVIVIKGTHLERDLHNGLLPSITTHTSVGNKAELLNALRQTQFDVLVSNGCPFILPLSELPAATYANIHPSHLPDLRGADPAIGAILFGRDAGATCHIMDAGVDTGPIISQVRIPYSDDLDVTTLYQLSFIAEKQVFSQSLAKNFQAESEQEQSDNLIYYSRKKEDRVITFKEPNDLIMRKIRAFNNRSQGCEFMVRGLRFRVFTARYLHNPFLVNVVMSFPELTVALSYENCIVFHKDGQILQFENIDAVDGALISVGDTLFAA